MTAANLDFVDLAAVADNGLIREDVMNQIWDISKIPLPFTDMVGSDTHTNQYTEWTQDTLGAQDLTNAVVDGADIDQNDTATGARVGNQTQISVKEVKVSSGADAVDTIGRARELAYQVSMRQQELRRDVEGIAVGQQASVADNGTTVPGKAGAFGAWLTTNVSFGATGSAGGYGATTPGIVDAPVSGTVRALTETLVRDISQSVWEEGGNTEYIMSTPGVIRQLSNYLFTSSARIATLTKESGSSAEGATAQGAVSTFITDFGQVLDMVPNRLQNDVTTDNATLYFIDPALVRLSYLRGYQVEPLSKTGLSEKRLMSVYWSLKVLNEKGLGGIYDINDALPVTQA